MRYATEMVSEQKSCRIFPLIKEVRAYVKQVEVTGDHGADFYDVEDKHWVIGYPQPIASPMSMYPQYQAYSKSWGINALSSVIVEVEADDGTIGVGVSIGGEPACYIIEKHLSRFIEGQEPCNIELMWDQMFRATIHYGRKGMTLQAISAVDLALWDLLGKLRNEPVYNLLGGKTKERLPVYCTTCDPVFAKQSGFVGAKIPCPYGPSEGDEGLKKNVDFFKQARQSVGTDFPLMLDCYMSLTVPYTIKLARELQPYNPKWIEEFLPPDNYAGYSEVHRALAGSVLLTTGEHEYTRYGYLQLLQQRCADIIQPDITWLGGLTEARKVVEMASAYDVMVIPHASSVYSYHLQYAFTNCPMAEYICLSEQGNKIVPYFGTLFFDEPLPQDGFIDLPKRSGFGVALNKKGLNRPYPRSPAEVQKQYEANIAAKQIPTKAKMPF